MQVGFSKEGNGLNFTHLFSLNFLHDGHNAQKSEIPILQRYGPFLAVKIIVLPIQGEKIQYE